jgi:ATP-binding cassette, subfamily B, bacterial
MDAPHRLPSTPFANLWNEAGEIIHYGRKVWDLLPAEHRYGLGGAALLMAAVAGANSVLPLLLGDLVDRVRVGAGTGSSFPPAAGLFLGFIAATYLIRELLNVLRRALVENSCTRIQKAMTTRVVSHLTRMDLGTLTAEKVGALQGRIGRSVGGLVRFVRLGFLDFFPPLFTGVFALAIALTRQPILGVVMACVIPASLYLTLRQLTSQKGVRLELLRRHEELDGTLVELLSGLDYVRASNTQEAEVNRVRAAAEARRLLERDHHWHMSLYGCVKALNEGLFHVIVLALAIYLAMNERISLGDVLTFSMLFLNVMAPLSEVHRGLDEGHQCSLMVADLVNLLDQPVDRSFLTDQGRVPRFVPGEPVIAARGLAVAYDTPAGPRTALDGVSLEIRHGETIGMAGPSGCGKSTFLRVLLRLTHPKAGEVEVGGVPLNSLTREEIGRLFGYVGQNPFVFSGTIAENIAYGAHGVTQEAIEEAARKASLHDEITWMPDGYRAPVRERGSNLSGGQRQRLALARVFLKDPPILILDESTSALDTISERHIQRAIDVARRDRTVILVAHRLTTLLDADRIFVFQWGKVQEEGNYDDLYRRGGFFAELVNSAETGVSGKVAASHLTSG